MPLQLTGVQDSHREPEHTPSNTFPGAADLTAHPKPWEQGPHQHLAHPKPHLSHPTGICSPGDTPKCWIIDLGWPERPGLNRRPARSTKHCRFRASLARGASSLLRTPTRSCSSPAAQAERAQLSRHTGAQGRPQSTPPRAPGHQQPNHGIRAS